MSDQWARLLYCHLSSHKGSLLTSLFTALEEYWCLYDWMPMKLFYSLHLKLTLDIWLSAVANLHWLHLVFKVVIMPLICIDSEESISANINSQRHIWITVIWYIGFLFLMIFLHLSGMTLLFSAFMKMPFHVAFTSVSAMCIFSTCLVSQPLLNKSITCLN